MHPEDEYKIYRRGWEDGASGRNPDTHSETETMNCYLRGFSDGRRSRQEALSRAAELFGLTM